MRSAESIFEEILSVFRANGDRHYGENVTELEHALQCAATAERSGEPADLVVACLLHDYGHLIHTLGESIADLGIDASHEAIGADFLQRYFPPRIVEPIRLHVAAKRYLCWKDPQYLSELSPASRRSLDLQGGVMNDAEAAEFEAHPHYKSAIRLRHYDDLGKVAGMHTPKLEEYREMVIQCVNTEDAAVSQ